jgi:hypothetical protein
MALARVPPSRAFSLNTGRPVIESRSLRKLRGPILFMSTTPSEVEALLAAAAKAREDAARLSMVCIHS